MENKIHLPSLFVFLTSLVFFLLVYAVVKYALGITIVSSTLIWAAWLLTILIFRLSGRATLISGLGLLISLPLVSVFGREDLAINIAPLTFFFLLTGTFQSAAALLKEGSNGNQDEF